MGLERKGRLALLPTSAAVTVWSGHALQNISVVSGGGMVDRWTASLDGSSPLVHSRSRYRVHTGMGDSRLKHLWGSQAARRVLHSGTGPLPVGHVCPQLEVSCALGASVDRPHTLGPSLCPSPFSSLSFCWTALVCRGTSSVSEDMNCVAWVTFHTNEMFCMHLNLALHVKMNEEKN